MNININDLYFSQNINRVGPVKETKQMENRTDNPFGKSFAEMIVEAQLERERDSCIQDQKKDSEEKNESENKKIVDPISLSYSQMMLNSLLISSSKKDEDKNRK